MHSEVNGDEDIKLKIYKQRNSNLDLKSISEMWTVTQDDIEYKITYIKQITNGNGFHLDVRGIPLFYDKFRTSIIHYLYNGSLTAVDYFTRVFDGTGYNFVLVNPSYAEQWEGFGKGQTRMELFKKGLDRYGYEFYIQGKTIYLKHQIGNDTNFEYRYKLNASNVSKAVDASALITHIKGFGNFEEGEEDYLNNAKLKREATSPLADIVGIRESIVVVDGRITRTDTMDARLQKEIDESLYITVEATLHDVRQMGYETAVPLKGDRTFLVDERLGFDAEIRVQSVTTTKDERNRITQCDVVFGSANAGKRFKSNLSTVAKNMADLLAGKIQLPFEVLESMSKDLLLKIQSVDSELLLDNGIFAIDKANPNNILGLNSAGIYISTDGGVTAPTVISADGIVANAITSGQILTHLVRVVGTQGLFSIDGDVAKWTDANDSDRYTEIRPGSAVFSKNITILRDDGDPFIQDGHALFEIPIITKPNMDIGVSFGSRSYETSNTDFSLFEAGYASHSGRLANFVFQPGMRWDSNSASAFIEVTIEVANAPDGLSIPPVTHRQIIYRDSGNESFVLNLRLPRVTYGALSFLLKFKIDTPTSGNYATIRSARCWISA